MIEYIQNLDTVLADLEKAKITIAETKYQFRYFDIKIVNYISDFEK